MGTTAVVGIVILTWILLSVVMALIVARVIRVRNRQHPRWLEPKPPAETGPHDCSKPLPRARRWRKRSKT